LARHKLAGDGISLSTLRELHDRIYQLAALCGGPRVELLPGRELTALTDDDGFTLRLRNQLDGEAEAVAADLVLLCTGLREQLPPCIESLLPELDLDEHGRPQVDANFEVRRRRPGDGRLYITGGGRTTHGIAESQLSLMAWRSAVILNDILGRRRFAVEHERELVRWRARPRADARST